MVRCPRLAVRFPREDHRSDSSPAGDLSTRVVLLLQQVIHGGLRIQQEKKKRKKRGKKVEEDEALKQSHIAPLADRGTKNSSTVPSFLQKSLGKKGAPESVRDLPPLNRQIKEKKKERNENEEEDADPPRSLVPGVGTHGVNASELSSALSGHHPHSPSREGITLILLNEIAYESDEDFCGHLPLLFHVMLISFESFKDIVLEHCQHLLVNLLYSLAGRHLDYMRLRTVMEKTNSRLSFRDRTSENVLLSSTPRDEIETSGSNLAEFLRMESRLRSEPPPEPGKEPGKVPSFEGVQPLVLKGLMSTVSLDSSIEILSRITLHSCDSTCGNSETRLLMHIAGLLPWQLTKGSLFGSTSLPQQQYQKACSIAANISI